jgi:hypothetical protein
MMTDDTIIIENYFNRPPCNTGSFEDIPLNSSLTSRVSLLQPTKCFWFFDWFYDVLISFLFKKA